MHLTDLEMEHAKVQLGSNFLCTKRLSKSSCEEVLRGSVQMGGGNRPRNAVQTRVLERDEFWWTRVITEQIKCRRHREALKIYEGLLEDGMKPSSYTFVAALKACSRLGDLEAGRRVHAHVMQMGDESQSFVANMLVQMYAKCGSMVDARRVFDKMRCREVVSWNVMILGYAQMEEGETALQLFAQMQREGMVPNDRTFVSALKACSSLVGMGTPMRKMCLENGRAIHSQVVKSGYVSDVFVATMLVDVYGKCGSMVDARRVFEQMPHRNVVSWTAIIMGYAQMEQGEVALQLYARMKQEGIVPNERTLVGALKACCSSSLGGGDVRKRWLDQGKAIHSDILKSGLETDLFISNMLVDMYGKCGSMVDARRVFDRLAHRDMVSWNALMAGYAEHGESRDVFQLYAQMQEQGLSADSWTFVSILRACGNAADLQAGITCHAQIRRSGLESTRIVTNALIDMYGKCGSMVDAQQLFDAVPTRDAVTWTALMAGYARHGQAHLVCDLFEKMRKEGLQPSKVTFLCVLTVCSHAGLVDRGWEYFEGMSRDYGITPTIRHYSCMVDLLGRAGQLEEAMAMADNMGFEPNSVTWKTLLAACRKWNDVEVGRQAFDRAVKSDRNDAAAFVLMSGIFADGHMWDDMEKMEAIRSERLWKKPGQSWCSDTVGIVHTFVAGDETHPETNIIYGKLKVLNDEIEERYACLSHLMPHDVM